MLIQNPISCRKSESGIWCVSKLGPVVEIGVLPRKVLTGKAYHGQISAVTGVAPAGIFALPVANKRKYSRIRENMRQTRVTRHWLPVGEERISCRTIIVAGSLNVGTLPTCRPIAYTCIGDFCVPVANQLDRYSLRSSLVSGDMPVSRFRIST